MYNYRLVNSNGKTLGVVSLETEELASLVGEGETMVLSAGAIALDDHGKKTVLEFIVTPELIRPSRIHVDRNLIEPVERM